MKAIALVAFAVLSPWAWCQESEGGATKPQDPTKTDDPYAKATKDFVSQQGVFKVWTKGESVLYEIPKPMLDRVFLWSVELTRTPPGSFSGTSIGATMVRWEERGDKVLLRSVNTRSRASGGGRIAMTVNDSNVDPIIRALKVEATGPDGSLVVDVSRLLKGDVAEFNVKGAFGGGNLDTERSFLDRVVAYPENVNAYVDVTYAGGAAAPTGRTGRAVGGPSSTGTVLHSMALLPKEPMQGRLWDSRVGYFSERVEDYGTDYHGMKEYRYIARYRLEKKDPKARLSEPVKPIVYYVSREVPDKWREYVKKGIEDWQPAFEEAGFKNAILAKDAPDDPNWSPEDVRHSVIRWAPLPIANAVGPHVHDPRSGEILSAHVIIWHDILALQAQWYFSQASAQDKRAQKLPLPDDLMGELLRFVVAHEVGHTLGLPHNGKSSAMVPVEKLRDPAWTKANGTCTSIMDYARFNYVAQPGDGANLIPIVGKYDKFSIQWGYEPIPDAKSPWEEVPTLDKWASRQVTEPDLRFYDNFSAADPTAQAEALGDDAVAASEYGTANLKRSMSFLESSTVKLGEDYSETSKFHSALVGQFGSYISHVTAVVGGVVQTDYHGGRGGAVYDPVPRRYQERAVAWLCDNVLEAPTWLVPADLVWKLGSDGGVGTVTMLQRRVVNGLLNGSRLNRMAINAATMGDQGYRIEEMVLTLRSSVFSDLGRPSVLLTPFRTGLHQAYLEVLGSKLTASDRSRAVARGELEAVVALLKSSLGSISDRTARSHYADLAAWGEWALANPDKAAPSDAAAGGSPFGIEDGDRHIGGCSLGGTIHGG